MFLEQMFLCIFDFPLFSTPLIFLYFFIVSFVFIYSICVDILEVLGELSELQIKALLPILTLGLSLVKVFCMLSCDWPKEQQGTSKIMIAALIKIVTLLNFIFIFYTQKSPATFGNLLTL